MGLKRDSNGDIILEGLHGVYRLPDEVTRFSTERTCAKCGKQVDAAMFCEQDGYVCVRCFSIRQGAPDGTFKEK